MTLPVRSIRWFATLLIALPLAARADHWQPCLVVRGKLELRSIYEKTMSACKLDFACLLASRQGRGDGMLRNEVVGLGGDTVLLTDPLSIVGGPGIACRCAKS